MCLNTGGVDRDYVVMHILNLECVCVKLLLKNFS